VGTLATVHKLCACQPESFVFTEGVERVRLLRYIQTEPFMIAEVEVLADADAKQRQVARRWYVMSSASSADCL